jgi:hypothetical protein
MGRSEARRLLLRAPAAFQESSRDGESLASVGGELVELDAAVNRLRDRLPNTAAALLDARRRCGVVAELDWGGPILRQSLERIGCIAQIVRLITAGCVFPGCDSPRAGRTSIM